MAKKTNRGKYIPRTESVESLLVFERERQLGLSFDQGWQVLEWAETRAPRAVDPVADAERQKLLEAQARSACLSYRHDYGLLPAAQQEALRQEAVRWLHAWQKEGL